MREYEGKLLRTVVGSDLKVGAKIYVFQKKSGIFSGMSNILTVGDTNITENFRGSRNSLAISYMLDSIDYINYVEVKR